MSSFRRDLLAGGIAGLLAGILLGWALLHPNLLIPAASRLGVSALALGLLVGVPLASLVGVGFGALFRFQPGGSAATMASGALYGLLWWILGQLTLAPLLRGTAPTWSLADAESAFPNLIGHLLFGLVLGLVFHLVRVLVERVSPSPSPDAIPEPTRRVVILGGGFGGVASAQGLEELLSRNLQFEIVLVSQSNYLLFTPMLAEVASSSLEAQHISAPVRASLTHTRFLHAEVVAIDPTEQCVSVRASSDAPATTLRYDHLVLALGSIPHYQGLPGMAEHSFTLKTLQDAMALRNHVIQILERADVESDREERLRLLTFVVAGGGFAGTEMIAELFDFVHSVLRFYPSIPRSDLRFALVHGRDRILPEIGAPLADYALKKLRSRGIEFLLSTRIAGATAGAVLLADGDQVPTRTLVWTAGNRPHPLLQTFPAERNRGGAIVAESNLQVQGLSNVWAVGDCAQVPDPDQSGAQYPPTAQHALRQGKVVAQNIVEVMRGRPPKPFRFRTIGMLVALGHRTAVAEVFGWQFSGLLAWLMWRMVYLSKLPGLEKKVRVMLDWLLDLFFPRDIVLVLGPKSAPRDVESGPSVIEVQSAAARPQDRPSP